MKKILILLIGVVVLSSCTAQKKMTDSSESLYKRKNLPLLQATLYHQTAAEMRALAYQAFNTAKWQLDQELKKAGLTRQQAVILDIDETVLDNSPFEAKLIRENESYPSYWAEWIKKQEAKPIPGALDFLSYANEKGIALFYVSNRHDSLRSSTLKNLRKFNFPQAKNDHLLLKTTTSGKEKRRQKIDSDYKIIMLIGDNLNDFSEVFEGGSVDERYAAADSLRNAFGKRFIVLPNAMYGEWEGAAIDYEYSASEKEKVKKKLDELRSFDN